MTWRVKIPIALSLVGVDTPAMLARDLSSFSVMVEVDGVREKVFARGPRWVSLSSDNRQNISSFVFDEEKGNTSNIGEERLNQGFGRNLRTLGKLPGHLDVFVSGIEIDCERGWIENKYATGYTLDGPKYGRPLQHSWPLFWVAVVVARWRSQRLVEKEGLPRKVNQSPTYCNRVDGSN
jgi:hypothetical protein